MPEIKHLANCTPDEFMIQSVKLRGPFSEWLRAVDSEKLKAEAAARAREQEYRRTLNEDGYATLHRSTPYTANASNGRLFSYLSYISFFCFLPSILGIKDPFTRFHAKQGRKLFWASLILSWIPGINAVTWLFQIALAVIGIRNVSSGVMQELPIVGRLGE